MFKELLNSKPFDVHKTSEASEVKQLAAHIINQAVEAGIIERVTKETQNNMLTLLLDLYTTYKLNPSVWIGISRNRNDYLVGSRYNKLRISYSPLITCMDCLRDLGLIEMRKGWRDRNTGKGFQTRIRALPALIDMAREHRLPRPEKVVVRKREAVVIKNPYKSLIEYVDSDETDLLRGNLDIINTAISAADIGLAIGMKDWEDIHAIIARDEDRTPVDMTKTQLYRVFNNSNIDSEWLLEGGRFYGGWWLELPKDYRRRLTINSKTTLEIDYSTMHPRILYLMEGIGDAIEGIDLYAVPGVERKAAKIALNIMLNAESREEAFKAAKLDKESFEAVEQHFEPISGYFYGGFGLYLQKVDSMIAENIMLQAIEEGEVVLPVHDSMVCRVPYHHRLRKIMAEQSSNMLQILPTSTEEYTPEISRGIDMREIADYTRWENRNKKNIVTINTRVIN